MNITIGIPAYNEEANIANLLTKVSRQKFLNDSLTKIIVCSDKSSDNTERIIRKIKNRKIELFVNRERSGQAFSQNEIIKKCKTDILVLLNADVEIKDEFYIHALIQPIVQGQADLTSSAIRTVKPKLFLDSVLNASIEIKNQIFESYGKGLNVYTCHGAARAFSKKLYRNFKFVDSIGEDAYSYLYSVRNDFRYSFVKTAEIFIKSPSTFRDHANKSTRFFLSKKRMEDFFGKEMVSTEYFLPVGYAFAILLRYFIAHPIKTTTYVCVLLVTKLIYLLSPKEINNTWSLSDSTKLAKA